MKEKTVIFDMDGVIFDTENLFLDCWRELAEQNHIKDVEQVYYKCIGVNEKATRAIFEEAYGEHFSYDELSGKAAGMFFRYVEEKGMPMKPGVRELLDFLTANGYKIGLASSTKEVHVKSQLASRNLLSYFQVVICGDMVNKSKPAPDIFLKACEEIGTLPEEAFAIEDSFHGIHAATAAGMKAIMVPDMVLPDEEMKGLAYRIFPSLIQVQEFFASCGGSLDN